VLSNTAVPFEYGQFRDKVLRGEIPVNREVSQQMNLIDALIADPRYYYDDQAIKGFEDFCESEMTLGDGSDLKLLPSFKLWAEDLLAWFEFPEILYYNQRTHRQETRVVKRRLRNVQYLIVGRGAAKSMYAAMIQAYGLVVDTSTTHQIVTAPTAKLAEETVSPIRTAIARSRGPLFSFLSQGSIKSNTWSKIKLASTKKGIENFMTNSLLEIRPMMIDRLQGARSKYNTIDEWLSGKVREDVIGAVEQGASKIDDYIIVATSSEGTARDGIGDEIKLGIKDKLEGNVYDPHASIWYYKLDNLKEISDPNMWLKANPNIGATVSYEAYQRDVDTAEHEPAKRNDILAKRFGIPVEGYTYFFTYEETIPHKKKNYNGMLCAVGGDLSQGDDFCAFTFLFPLQNGQFGIKTRSYVSDFRVKKLPSTMQLKYKRFVREGSLAIMDGNVLDMVEVYEDLEKFIDEHEYDVTAMGYDPYNAQLFVQNWVQHYGEYGVEKVIQGARTESVPMGEIKNLSESGDLLFDEELMSFAMGNAIALQDNNGNYKLDKRRREEKIDNVAALIDAWVIYKRYQEAFM
jgi:phage terminase large subunit-like protein